MENQLSIALSRNKLLKNANISKMDLGNVHGKLITISEGEILYREGDKADGIFLVVSGEINVLKKRLLGKTKSYLFNENDFFGHEEFFEEISRTSTAVALRDSYLISLTRAEVEILIQQNNNVLNNLREPVEEVDAEVSARKEEPQKQTHEIRLPEKPEGFTAEIVSKAEETKDVTAEKSKDYFQSISDFSRVSDENIIQPLDKSTTFKTPFDMFGTNIIEDFSETAKEEKTTQEKPPFDESAFFNEDGIPKANFELPDTQEQSVPELNKTEDDLNDALFKILSGTDESPAFVPKKDFQESAAKETDEAFLSSFAIPETDAENIEPSKSVIEPPEKEIEAKPELSAQPQPPEKKTIVPQLPHDDRKYGKEDFLEEEKVADEGEPFKIPPVLPSLKDKSTVEFFEEVDKRIKNVEQSVAPQIIEPVQTKQYVPPAQKEPEIVTPTAPASHAMSADELHMIIKAAELVNSDIRVEEVLKNIVAVATNLTEADRGTLYLVDKEKGELWSLVTLGDEMREIRLRIGEGLAGYVAKSGETININDVRKDPRFNPEVDRASGYITKNMICFPIKNNKSEIIGVLQLINSGQGEFTKRDEEFLNALSINSAIALQNAELVEKLLQGERVHSLGKMANFLIQDIKKPILVGKRYAEHLRSKQLPPDSAQIVEMLLEQLGQVADLVQTTSSYSEGKTILRTLNVSLNNTLTDYASRVEQYVDSRLCQIVNEHDKDVTVKIDVKEFFQCYMNIIKNACDAMPDGGNIFVSTKRVDKKVEISFKDNGLGIPDGFKDKIFEPFMSHGKKEGTGLGLSITRKIVEALNGKVEAKSNLGEGATFTITLPIVPGF